MLRVFCGPSSVSANVTRRYFSILVKPQNPSKIYLFFTILITLRISICSLKKEVRGFSD